MDAKTLEASYSGDLLCEGKARNIIPIGNALYIVTGLYWLQGLTKARLDRVVPLEDFPKDEKPTTYDERCKTYTRDDRSLFYRGLTVVYKGSIFVMMAERIEVTPDEQTEKQLDLI